MSVEEDVKKVVIRVVRKSEEDFTPETTFEDLEADSLDVVQILTSLEDMYDIEDPDDSWSDI